jgi:hypothetical protein
MDFPGCKKMVGNEALAEQHAADVTSLCRETGKKIPWPGKTSFHLAPFAANRARAGIHQISITTVALLT